MKNQPKHCEMSLEFSLSLFLSLSNTNTSLPFYFVKLFTFNKYAYFHSKMSSSIFNMCQVKEWTQTEITDVEPVVFSQHSLIHPQ